MVSASLYFAFNLFDHLHSITFANTFTMSWYPLVERHARHSTWYKRRRVNFSHSIRVFLFRQLVSSTVFFSLSHFQQIINHTSHWEYGKHVLSNMIDLQHQTFLATLVKRVFELGSSNKYSLDHEFHIKCYCSTFSFHQTYRYHKPLIRYIETIKCCEQIITRHDSWQEIPLAKKGMSWFGICRW